MIKADRILFVSNENNDKIPEARRIDNLIVQSENNPEFGTIAVMTSERGIGRAVQAKEKYCFLFATVESLKKWRDEHKDKIAPGKDYCNVMGPARLVINDTTEPQFEGHTPKKYPPSHKKAGQFCLHAGMKVYRNIDIVPASSEVHDVVLSTDRDIINHDDAKDKGEVVAKTVEAETGA